MSLPPRSPRISQPMLVTFDISCGDDLLPGHTFVARGLADEGRSRRLMIVITDGKPNDLDHYEGRHGIEDSAMAVREARRAGHSVFGITIDKGAQSWFPRIFGQGGFSVIRDPDRLTNTLPQIYRQLVL